MSKYYYLIASLIPLDANGHHKTPDYDELTAFIKRLLSQEDRKLFEYLLYPYEIKYIINQLAEERNLAAPYPFILLPAMHADIRHSVRGAQLLNEVGFMKDSGKEISADELNQMTVPEIETFLLENFYEAVFRLNDSFLTAYFNFEKDLRNTIAVSNSRKFDFNPEKYLIATSLYNGRSKENLKYNITSEYSFASEIGIRAKHDSPKNLEKVLDRIRWKFIEELTAFSFFDLHVVFGYFLKLQIHLRWTGDWSKEDASARMHSLLQHSMEGFTVPESFTTLKRKSV